MASLSIPDTGPFPVLVAGSSDSSPSASLDGFVTGLVLFSALDCFLPRPTFGFLLVAEAAALLGDEGLASVGWGKKKVGFFSQSSLLNVPDPAD